MYKKIIFTSFIILQINLALASSTQSENAKLHAACEAIDKAQVKNILDANYDNAVVNGRMQIYSQIGTPLHQIIAAAKETRQEIKDSNEIVKMLINHGASIEEKTTSFMPNTPSEFDGSTALHIAASFGDYHSVLLLIEAGADTNSKNAAGHTPLDLAYQGWQKNSTALYGNSHIVIARAKALGVTGISLYDKVINILLENGGKTSTSTKKYS